ncbi:MAG: DNA polymerase III subunit delta' [Pseudomonadota bacterium]
MSEELILADVIEGIPHPGECRELVGHREAVEGFLERYRSGKLHHAHLVTGPKGIGKVTFALKMAGHLFRYPDPASAPVSLENSSTTRDAVDGKIAAASHPNLLHLSRPWDFKEKKFKTKLTVDEVRLTVPFFGTSKAEKGWRVAIIDAVDDMNQNASNALLKILEEPPERTVFFVIAHSAATVLPTIRSRCQHLVLKPLEGDEVLSVLDGFDIGSNLSSEDRKLLATLADGSVRSAITLAHEDGLELYRDFNILVGDLSKPDWAGIHSLAEKVSLRAKEDRYRLLLRFAEQFMEAKARGSATDSPDISVLARWAEVWEKTRNSIRTADAYNLDRKQTVLNLFSEMGEVVRR